MVSSPRQKGRGCSNLAELPVGDVSHVDSSSGKDNDGSDANHLSINSSLTDFSNSVIDTTDACLDLPGSISSLHPPRSWPNDFGSLPAPREKYSYVQLPDSSSIRVLKLWPGTGSDHIKCSLQPAMIEDVVDEYDALSYVWGSESPSRTVEVDGCPLAIRDNLFNFLARLRDPDVMLSLWADAICINQNSTEERNDQVQQMGKIYKSSRVTRLWLGHGDSDVHSFLQWTEGGPINESYEENHRYITSAEVNGVKKVIDNDYWTRLWIVQEVILSREIQVHIHQREFAWINFVDCCYLALRACNWCTQETNYEYEDLGMIYVLDEQRRKESVWERRFADLIRSYGSCKCFDIRDRVFGLAGLADDLALDVDYNLSPIQVFANITRTHSIDFTDDVTYVLYKALGLSSRMELGHDAQLINVRLKIRRKIKKSGQSVWQNERLKWDVCGSSQLPLSSELDLHSTSNPKHENQLYNVAKRALRAGQLSVLRHQEARKFPLYGGPVLKSIHYYTIEVTALAITPMDVASAVRASDLDCSITGAFGVEVSCNLGDTIVAFAEIVTTDGCRTDDESLFDIISGSVLEHF
ncbi:hypothetical protein GLAREA_08473 [Glarea lozoyensis ATCC 20868]|uniref:Heterokaryon incompatibility domain-containing protein n=1 Tax=Glarea lozoyensis (strain ATCC 20868 / MF5171) TaxID=1116229 RepID=S3CF67_GLAL2|nr:uncharacterized protein GLAREA_08473 [Glarea lozoyensis ATCC 20868]EPE24620.1 hypothetical protein GLAREA_08473 [Glarea lozoyensis ATCC 20868]